MEKRNRQLLLGALVGLGVVLASVAAVAAFGASGHVARAFAPQSNVDIASHFAAFSDPTLPAAPAAITADFAEIHTGITAARQVGDGSYLADFNGAVCVVVKPGSSGCTDQLDHGVWLLGYTIRAFDSETAPFNVNLYGVAEDGISAISATLANGTTTTIPVVNNAFGTTLPNTTFSDIRALSVDTAAGQVALDPAQYFPAAAPAVQTH